MGWSRALKVACTTGSIVLCGCSGDAGPGPSPLYSVELPVSEAAPAVWTRDLPAGAYLLSAREVDIDFRLTVEAPGKRTTLEDEVARHGLKTLVVDFPAPATLRMRIENSDFRDWKGKAQLGVVRLRESHESPDERELGYISFGLGGARLSHGTYAERETAVEYFRDAVRHFTAANDIAARAEAHYALASTEYTLRTSSVAAVAATELARADFAATGNALGEQDAITLRAMSDIEIAWKMNAAQKRAEQQELYRSADARLRSTTEYFDRHGQNLRRDYALNVRGIGVLYSGDYENAVPIFEEAIRRATAIGDTRERLKRVSNLSWTHNRLGLFEKSTRGLERVLPLADRQRDGRQYAYMLGNYGISAVAIGEFDSALTAQAESHALFVENGMRAEAANALSSIGGIYLRIGDYERALKTLDLALADFEAVRDYGGVASAARMAGNAATSLGKHQKALAYLRRAMSVEGIAVNTGRTHVLIARVLRELGDHRGAARELEQALQVDSAILRATALEERGRLHVARGDPARALVDLREADRGFATLGVDLLRIETNTALSQVLLARGDAAEAARFADIAIALESDIRLKSANPEWRASLLSSSYAPYEARIEAELHGKAEDPERAWRAFKIAAHVRERAISEQRTASAGTAAKPGGDLDALRAKLTAQLGRLESRLQRSGPDDPAAIELRRVVEVTRAEFAGRHALTPTYTSAPSLPASIAGLQASLPSDLAVLAFFTGDRTTHAWLLTRDEFRHFRASGAGALSSRLDAFVAALRRAAGSRHGVQLGEELLGDLLHGVTATRLVVVPDGPLNVLPFAALPVPGSKDQLLVDRFVISMSPSLTLALNSAAPAASRPTRVAVVSDPVYSLTDRRLLAAAAERTSVLRDSQIDLARLPYSAIEARAVRTAFGPANVIDLSGFDATSTKVLELQALPLRVLHFATHARSAEAFEDSALFLSRFGPDGRALTESSLTADDISHSHLHAELVVLSGCATGEGRELRGGGVLGLTHGFLANGARSVIASLWPIEDAPTARFMEEFYAAYRVSGRAAEALRFAQLRTRNGPAKAVWSSFVVRANELP